MFHQFPCTFNRAHHLCVEKSPLVCALTRHLLQTVMFVIVEAAQSKITSAMTDLTASLLLVIGFLQIVCSYPSSNPSEYFDGNLIPCYKKGEKDIPDFW